MRAVVLLPLFIVVASCGGKQASSDTSSSVPPGGQQQVGGADGGGGVAGHGGGGGGLPPSTCVPGQQIACACVGGVQGVQACVADGSAYAACQCPTGTGGGGSGGAPSPLGGAGGANGGSAHGGGGVGAGAGAGGGGGGWIGGGGSAGAAGSGAMGGNAGASGAGAAGMPSSCTLAVCGRAMSGIVCAWSMGDGFSPASTFQPSFGDAEGWNVDPSYYSTIRFPDVNADGLADVCGRGPDGIHCALSTGGGFGPSTLWSPFYSDAGGWSAGPQYYTTIQFVDLNSDGRADVCGRAPEGMRCALSTGMQFGPATVWQSNPSDANGWAGAPYYSTIGFADVNGDGRPDYYARGNQGILIGLSNGSTFTDPPTWWQKDYSDANGWFDASRYATLGVIDLNGDGRADVCGRNADGIACAVATGTSFALMTTWSSAFSDALGWSTDPSTYTTIRYPDVDGDGRADVCGRSKTGVVCAASTGVGFAAPFAESTFGDANGWNQQPYYRSIQFPDVDGDGRADVCGRGPNGIVCERSIPGGFDESDASHVWASEFHDQNGWSSAASYGTIRFARIGSGACP